MLWDLAKWHGMILVITKRNRIRELLKRVIENKQVREKKRKKEFTRRLKYGKFNGTEDPGPH